MSPSARRALGSFAIIAWLVFYIGIAAAVGDRLAGAHPLVTILYFAVAGIAWIFPLRPLFKWMGAGTP
jgi:pheromone shutdown protein TraB